MELPSVKAQQLLRALKRKPLGYRVVRQNGSHRHLESDLFPPIDFAWHDNATVPRGAVRSLLCKRVGLSQQAAIDVIKGKAK